MPHVQLSTGATHYELLGQQEHPLVVLVHGISMPMWSWDHVAPALVDSGFRVLRYDVLGRGDSAYPRRRYDRALLRDQLRELLDALGFTTPINLAGFSLGGALAANFTASHPQRVARLALAAPYARMQPPDQRRLARLPLAGELLMRFALPRKLNQRAQRLLLSSSDPAGYAARFAAQVARPEFRRAFLSLLRSDGLDDYAAVYDKVAASGVPTTLIWGTQDSDVDRASIEDTRARLRPQAYHPIDGADHGSIVQAGHGLERLLAQFFGGA
jgi:pimeloyl-ACP methyl ester carboxylesterase